MIRWAAGLIVLQLLDVLTTYIGLARGASEANPVGVILLGAGPWLLIVAKVAGTGLILYVCARIAEKPGGPPWARAGLVWSCFVMVGVVLWNSSRIMAY